MRIKVYTLPIEQYRANLLFSWLWESVVALLFTAAAGTGVVSCAEKLE